MMTSSHELVSGMSTLAEDRSTECGMGPDSSPGYAFSFKHLPYARLILNIFAIL